MSRKKKVIFICTQNSARSQMAEGLLRSLYGDYFEVFSAGTNPLGVNPYAIRVMDEIGVDISDHRSKSIDEFKGINFDIAATVCSKAKEACPYFAASKIIIHRDFEDPAAVVGSEEEILNAFRRVRDRLQDWIKEEFKRFID